MGGWLKSAALAVGLLITIVFALSFSPAAFLLYRIPGVSRLPWLYSSSLEDVGPAASRAVQALASPAHRLTQAFTMVRQFENPCGSFGPAMSFGADGDLLRIECIPDMRTAVDDGWNGLIGTVSPPEGSPWRVAYDLSSGREIARLQTYTSCSREFDDLELALGRGYAAFGCRKDKSDFSGGEGQRVVLQTDQARIEEYIEYDYNYTYIYAQRVLVRQRNTSAPQIELHDPSRHPPGAWEVKTFPAGQCARAWGTTLDGKALIARFGQVTENPGPPAFSECSSDSIGVIELGAVPGFRELAARGPIGIASVDSRRQFVSSENYIGNWETGDPIVTVIGEDGSQHVSIVAGSRVSSVRYSGIDALVGEGLLAVEIAPRLRLGSKPFLYAIFDWSGRPLARLYATRLALAPDRHRVVAVLGTKLQVWDRKEELN